MNTQESDPVRVLHVVGDSRFGGAAWIILGLGEIAKSEGWHVDVLTTDSMLQQAVREAGLGLVTLDLVRREINPARDLAGLVRLRDFIQRGQYRIVHTHTSKGGFVGRLAARLAGVPVVVHTAHGFAIHEKSPAAARVFCAALERIASNWCDRVVTVSEFHHRWALDLKMCNPAGILAIPNGVADAREDQRSSPAEVRRRLGFRDGDLFLLTTARLAGDKGLDYLIRAVELLPQGRRRYRLIIAGDGPVRAQLEELARELGVADRVTFLGFRKDIGDLLSACDLVVLPSLREGLSMALLEAMSAGRPIIASSIGSHRELAAQADIARLVPPADERAIAEAILELGRDPARMAHLGNQARALFERRYTEERMLGAYRQLYFDLLKTKCPDRQWRARSEGRQPMSRTSNTSAVRTARVEDLPEIVTIHQKAFSQFFLTRLGPEFLRLYYGLVLDYHSGIVLVSEGDGGLQGFVCGFVDPPEFYRSMWRKKRSFVLPALPTVIRHPSLVGKVLNGMQRIQTEALQGRARACELSSIAVAPEAAGRGLGKILIDAFLTRSWTMNAQCVYLTTDAEANEVANALYRETGFQRARRFLQRKDRWMNEYVIHRAPEEVLA